MGIIAGVQAGMAKVSILGSRPGAAALLLAGMVICLGSALGLTGALCVTEGCRVYQDYSLLGLSLHIWGAAAFGTGLFLLLWSMTLYRLFLYLCLWAEIVLLAWQVIYLPCSECLLTGLIWGALALVEIRERLPVKVWSVVFLAALVLMGKDLVRPWPVYGDAQASMQVYFSPTCPGCREEIGKLLAGGEVDPGRVAFMPVALKSGDCERIEVWQTVFRRTLNVDQAFQACWSENMYTTAGWRDWLTVRLGLICNRLMLARMGVNKIPVVVSGAVGLGSVSTTGECGFDEGRDCPEQAAVVEAPVQEEKL